MSARHCGTWLLAALLLGYLSGCRQAWLTPGNGQPGDRARLGDPFALANAGGEPGLTPDEQERKSLPLPVSTVNAPDRPGRPITLAECICLALENGRTGEFYDRVGTDRRTSVNGLQGQASPSGSSDSIRVFAYDPAIAAAGMEQSLARFDTLWRTVAAWDHVAPVSGLTAETTPTVGVLNLGQVDTGQFSSELLKPLPTGGVAGITFRTDYERSNFLPGSPVLNPAYQPGVDFTFEQPLLQGAGVLLNRVREAFPSAVRQPVPSTATPPGSPGILIARLGRDQARLEFERRIHEMLFAVEQAYWDLYCAYWDLYSRDSGLRQAQLAWQVAKQRFDAGGLTVDDLAQIEEQLHFFRSQRLEALGRGTPGRPGVLEAERHLRYLVGLPAEDGSRLVPTDTPVQAPVEPDWEAAVSTAQQNRPELLQVHKEIQTAQLALIRAGDYTLPDLRFFSKYSVNGLIGSLPNNQQLAQPFTAWEAGLQLEVPIGFRAARSAVTRSRLELAQRFAFLHDQESKLLSSLQRSYQDLVQFREEMTVRHSQREAAAVQLKARYTRFQGKGDVSSDLLVRTQRSWADALRDEYIAICNYNVALADFERQKGTIALYHNIEVTEGMVPTYAIEHASRHIRERTLCPAVQPIAKFGPPQPLDSNSTEGATLPDLVDNQPRQILQYLGPSANLSSSSDPCGH
jgi:outer membrane protein TolC